MPVNSDLTLYAFYTSKLDRIHETKETLKTSINSVCFETYSSSPFILQDGSLYGIEIYVQKSGGEKTLVTSTYSKTSSVEKYIFEYTYTPVISELGQYTIYVKSGTSEKSYNFNYSNYQYIVNFETNGGSAIASKTVGGANASDYLINLKSSDYISTKSGYVLVGWYTDSALTTPVTLDADGNFAVTGNCTLYAKWGVARTVTLDKDYRNSTSSTKTTITVGDGGKVEISENPSLTFHTFMGWSTSKDSYVPYDFNTPVTSDLTLYAIYIPIIYSVHSSLYSCTTSNGSVCFETTSTNPFTFTDGSLYGIGVDIQRGASGERTSVSSTYSKTSSSRKDVFEYTFTPVTEPGTYIIYVKFGNSEISLTNAFTVE